MQKTDLGKRVLQCGLDNAVLGGWAGKPQYDRLNDTLKKTEISGSIDEAKSKKKSGGNHRKAWEIKFEAGWFGWATDPRTGK